VKIGLFGINAGICADPGVAARVARTAESAGLDSLWTAEHVVLPDPHAPPSPLPPEFPLLDPAVSLAWIAAHTKSVRLGTGIIILPQRNPLVLAKELASVDVVSGGRLIFGLGIGYLEAEFRALGVPFEDKAARAMEYLEAMQSVWSDPSPAYEGRFVSFSGIQARPRPVQQPGPEIVMGGHSRPAFRRAVAHAQGWYGFSLDPAATAAALQGLEEAAGAVERAPGLGRLEISITPPPASPIDAAVIDAYAALGVDRLIPFEPVPEPDRLVSFVEDLARFTTA
jgi:probable F420-dependent oxidoreductase